MTSLPHAARLQVLRFAAVFLWADFRVDLRERAFLTELARELELSTDPALAALLSRPPAVDDVDPTRVSRPVAEVVRQAVLRAIAADGEVDEVELHLFDVLDALLPRRRPRRRRPAA